MSKKVAVLLALFMLMVTLQAYADDEPVIEAEPAMAPLNPEYVKWVQAHSTSGYGPASEPDEGEFYGLVPMPVDLSHLAANPPKVSGVMDDLPVSYDIRKFGWVSPVRRQSPFGTCWAFAAIGAMESNYLRNGDKYLGDEIDLSEMHLAWFVYKAPGEGKAFAPFHTKEEL